MTLKVKKVFAVQKKIIRTMSKTTQRTTSCRNFSEHWAYSPLPCVYISEMVCWIKYYRGKLEFNSDVHDHNTRHKTDLQPLTHWHTTFYNTWCTYIYIYIYIYMERLFLMFLDHTQRRSKVGRTPLDE